MLFTAGSLRPGTTRQSLTERVAASFVSVAQALRERGHNPSAVAHFVNRLVFCMFADDVGLLPDHMFTRMLRHALPAPAQACCRIPPRAFASSWTVCGRLYPTLSAYPPLPTIWPARAFALIVRMNLPPRNLRRRREVDAAVAVVRAAVGRPRRYDARPSSRPTTRVTLSAFAPSSCLATPRSAAVLSHRCRFRSWMNGSRSGEPLAARHPGSRRAGMDLVRDRGGTHEECR